MLGTEGVSSRYGCPVEVIAVGGVRWTLVSSSQLPVEVVEIVEAVEEERSVRGVLG